MARDLSERVILSEQLHCKAELLYRYVIILLIQLLDSPVFLHYKLNQYLTMSPVHCVYWSYKYSILCILSILMPLELIKSNVLMEFSMLSPELWYQVVCCSLTHWRLSTAEPSS